MKTILLIITLSLCVVINAPAGTSQDTSQPPATADMPAVPDLKLDRATAIKLAEAILVRIYGEKVLRQRPWKVVESKNEFTITGTLHSQLGGVAEISISKSDARVIRYTHGK